MVQKSHWIFVEEIVEKTVVWAADKQAFVSAIAVKQIKYSDCFRRTDFCWCFWISELIEHLSDTACTQFVLLLCVRAGVAAAAWLYLSGCVGFDCAGPPGAAGQRWGHAERSAGRCWTPEQQSRTHCELDRTGHVTNKGSSYLNKRLEHRFLLTEDV